MATCVQCHDGSDPERKKGPDGGRSGYVGGAVGDFFGFGRGGSGGILRLFRGPVIGGGPFVHGFAGFFGSQFGIP